MSKVWFITGAGRGMGVDIAKAALCEQHLSHGKEGAGKKASESSRAPISLGQLPPTETWTAVGIPVGSVVWVK